MEGPRSARSSTPRCVNAGGTQLSQPLRPGLRGLYPEEELLDQVVAPRLISGEPHSAPTAAAPFHFPCSFHRVPVRPHPHLCLSFPAPEDSCPHVFCRCSQPSTGTATVRGMWLPSSLAGLLCVASPSFPACPLAGPPVFTTALTQGAQASSHVAGTHAPGTREPSCGSRCGRIPPPFAFFPGSVSPHARAQVPSDPHPLQPRAAQKAALDPPHHKSPSF